MSKDDISDADDISVAVFPLTCLMHFGIVFKKKRVHMNFIKKKKKTLSNIAKKCFTLT